jgi:hypothetical protein
VRVTESVGISAIQKHLKTVAAGVLLDLRSMPGRPAEYKGFAVRLDADDADKLVLWWEFENHTNGKSCRLTDALESVSSLPKVKSFLEGTRPQGRGPSDLRTSPNMEPVIVTDDLGSKFLYSIDGNHRILAQHLSQKGFQDVPAYVCVHPKMLEWAYIPRCYKRPRT